MGGGEGYIYSYIRVLPNGFLMKSIVFNFRSFKRNSLGRTRTPPPPINALVTPLGKTSFIPEYITIHRFFTKFKIDKILLSYKYINRDYVSPETEFCSVCVFLIVTPSKLFRLVFDFSAVLSSAVLSEFWCNGQPLAPVLPSHYLGNGGS